MQRILSTFNNKSATESEAQVYIDLSKYDILAIDDVGKYKANDMNFYRRVMFQIIDTRYNNHQGIIISSNLSKDNLGRFVGKANVDRLRGMAGEYKLEFKGQSHRGN